MPDKDTADPRSVRAEHVEAIVVLESPKAHWRRSLRSLQAPIAAMCASGCIDAHHECIAPFQDRVFYLAVNQYNAYALAMRTRVGTKEFHSLYTLVELAQIAARRRRIESGS